MAHELFYQLFLRELGNLYSSETEILNSLPEIIQATTSTELKEALEHHQTETKNQLKRLEQIYEELGVEYPGEKCEGMIAILNEGRKILFTDFPDYVKDAALIGAAQRVEHYEIASYGTARTFAEHLNLDDVAELLQKNLDEESNADKTLTEIAKGGFFTSGVNKKALEE